MDALSQVDTEGLRNLITALMNLLFQLDIRVIDSETTAKLLTVFWPIWNPIWEAVNDWLGATFGFNTTPII